jgi:predicted Zn-dependent protease
MPIPARYHDGVTARPQTVGLLYESLDGSGTLVIVDLDDRSEITRWPVSALSIVPGRRDELRLMASGGADGARVVVRGSADIARIKATLPVLQAKQRLEARYQIGLAALATAALGAVILAYLYGVPLIAGRIVGSVPPDWERSLGATVAMQMEAGLGGNVTLCDPAPESVANLALARFGATALANSDSPFDLDIRVIHSPIANAFAMPGGRIYVFSGLLDQADSQDEFAGVLAHEIGHVAYRHGMEQLISSAGTGALIGFILGDMTGVSIAAGLGATVIDSRFSREAERQADAYAARLAQTFDFNPVGLADLLDRVGGDDELTRALALFSTHPLTAERKAALELLSRERPAGLPRPFSDAEWSAIRSMCKGLPIGDGQIGST